MTFFQLTASVMNDTLSPEQIKEFESIDKSRTMAMKQAERHCRKLRMGEVKWSPKLQAARDKIEYLTLSRRKKQGRKVSASILYKLSKRTKCYVVNSSTKHLEEVIKEAYKDYKKMKKEHEKLREDYLDELALALEKGRKRKKSLLS